ncbi:Uncharacterised protein [Klebsiella oxytoca]|nr:Uncharacterised protein [Klebsiella oxytoca]
MRRYQQVIEADRTIGVFDKVKYPADFIGDARIGGQQRIVGVQTRGFFVEVAGTYVRIAHDFITLFTRNQEQLGVNFETRGGENDVHASFGQAFSPVNIGFFIETRL